MKDRKLLPNNENSEGKFEEFLEGFREYEKDILASKAQDAFLDAYSLWLKTKSLKDKLEAIKLGMRFEALNPAFSLANIFPLK
ncbi:MAG: hypothetical protein PHQ54_03575 [Candidatus Omnitrophica bacterium]|nr:hypothetical protein [Candidatus Omnitrophota bacterium]